MRLPLLLASLLALAQSCTALYFYLGAGENRCFIEELPKDTIVVGELAVPGLLSPLTSRWEGALRGA